MGKKLKFLYPLYIILDTKSLRGGFLDECKRREHAGTLKDYTYPKFEYEISQKIGEEKNKLIDYFYFNKKNKNGWALIGEKENKYEKTPIDKIINQEGDEIYSELNSADEIIMWEEEGEFYIKTFYNFYNSEVVSYNWKARRLTEKGVKYLSDNPYGAVRFVFENYGEKLYYVDDVYGSLTKQRD